MRIVIIGSGLAGVTLAEEIKKRDSQTEVTILTLEKQGYYSRPLLSHSFSSEENRNRIVMKTFLALVNQGIQVISGVEVTSLNTDEKKVSYRFLSDEKSDFILYDKLVLAQGSQAFVPPDFLNSGVEFNVLNSLEDMRQIQNKREEFLQSGQIPRVLIIGGGLIGCEVASDLNLAGDQVTIFHAMDRLMERQLTETESQKLLVHFTQMGIQVKLNQKNISQLLQEKKMTDEKDKFDMILVATGFKPRVELAKSSDIKVDRGIVVNSKFETSVNNIYAIGDAAQVFSEDGSSQVYAFVSPIRSQALWLAQHLISPTANLANLWQPPVFKPMPKIRNFKF